MIRLTFVSAPPPQHQNEVVFSRTVASVICPSRSCSVSTWRSLRSGVTFFHAPLKFSTAPDDFHFLSTLTASASQDDHFVDSRAYIPSQYYTGDPFRDFTSEPFPAEVAKKLLQPLSPDDIEIKPEGLIYLPEISIVGYFLMPSAPAGGAWCREGTRNSKPFPAEVAKKLLQPLSPDDIEIKPEGLIYLPEIKYRRILLNAFGPGGWGLVPRGDPQFDATTDQAPEGSMTVFREYAMFCMGQFVSQAVGEQTYVRGSMSLPTAVEGARSNAMMRCCKDLGIASDLWDLNFVNNWKQTFALQVRVENVKTKESRILWRRKDRPKFDGLWREV
eukprot:CAMPEP_0196666702 /NCGR_PEP_ID=MMETSP1086-20130531/64666_1 /TAXON_ID=77921 /ORGANISM="Cyanoptyche  gloeocystis , Strain SAG4.97" /LENGTH=330 /DNA_ID=CAMNT_0042003935 /DNA_START=27 /DNA_END=1020 /DNA_ORIENTATION=-